MLQTASEMPRPRVALIMTNGARVQPECRENRCDWTGEHHVRRLAAERERDVHIGWHIAERERRTSTPVTPVTPAREDVR